MKNSICSAFCDLDDPCFALARDDAGTRFSRAHKHAAKDAITFYFSGSKGT